jgi:L-asparaginase II
MLAVSSARGWERAGYRLPAHPLQQELLTEVAAAAELPADRIGLGVDGCGVVSFALPLERMAGAFADLTQRPGGREVAAAMQAHPELIRGPGAPDTELMRSLPGWIAKGGAEGVFCAGGPGGFGLALKVEDGAGRAIRPALAAFAGRLGLDLPQGEPVSVDNSRGELVGELVALL